MIESDRIAKRFYVEEYAERKCLKKRGVDIRQDRRMVQNRSKWRGFVKGNAWGIAWRMNP